MTGVLMTAVLMMAALIMIEVLMSQIKINQIKSSISKSDDSSDSDDPDLKELRDECSHLKIANKKMKNKIESLETKLMQQLFANNRQELVVNQTKSKNEQLLQLSDNPILKDLLAGKGVFNIAKKL